MGPGPLHSTSTSDDTPPFLVGIAGASSSGKTVLSLVLSEIFQAAMNHEQQISALHSTGSTTNASTITMISQDDYFVPNSDCPRITFRPRPGDELVVAGHVGPDGRVETANTDCLAAVDWVRLLGDVDTFLTGQKQQGGAPGAVFNVTSTHQTELAHYRTMMDCFVEPQLRQRLIADVRACIDAQVMLNTFHNFVGRLFKRHPRGTALLNCRLGFVEGFLLYAKEPPLSVHHSPHKGLGDGRANASGSNQRHHQPESRLQLAIKASQEAIRCRFHDRLYIHVTTETACQRRFSRDLYIDQPQGQRKPGQMWKTRGYYLDVVRANFYNYDSGNPALATQLWQGQDIVENAVQSILGKMKEYEADAREVVKNLAKEEETMARVKGETNTFW